MKRQCCYPGLKGTAAVCLGVSWKGSEISEFEKSHGALLAYRIDQKSEFIVDIIEMREQPWFMQPGDEA